MKEEDKFLMDLFDSQQKAVDHALWLNFKYRIAKIKFGHIYDPDTKWAVLEQDFADELDVSFLKSIEDYQTMDYQQIRHIRMDKNPLPHWEKIMGIISAVDGEILRYLLHAKIPMEKLIRYELYSRGYDKNHRWCGFEKASKIWLDE